MIALANVIVKYIVKSFSCAVSFLNKVLHHILQHIYKMAANGQRYSHGVAIILNIAAIILCSVGMFVDKWWVDETGDFHGIFTIITCQEGVCVLGISSTDSKLSYSLLLIFM